MRIVYVLASLGVGGAERQALEIADRMARRGHSVAILVLMPVVAREWPVALPVTHLDMRKSAGSVIAGVAKAWRFLRTLKPDLIHSHSFHANMLARLLKLLLPGVKLVSTIHNVCESGRGRMLAYRLTGALAGQMTAVSAAARDRYVRAKAMNASRCCVVLNGIDIDEFAPNPARDERARAEMSAGKSFIWMATGRLVAAKDYPNMLRAFALVRTEFPETQLWIAGAPDPKMTAQGKDGSAVSVEGFAIAHGLIKEGVRLLGPRRDVAALLDAGDAFVSSSASEGMPLAVGEAMAMEKPVVANDVGGTRELVGDAGTIVPAGNSPALAAAMMAVMRQTELQRRAQGKKARRRIASAFSINDRANEWESLYRSLVAF
jgi:glycosyltransferase involved in cell wall biosynthesis